MQSLNFGCVRKPPVRKLNPVLGGNSTKRDLKSSSNNKLSVGKSTQVKRTSQDKLQFKVKKSQIRCKNSNSHTSDHENRQSGKLKICSQTSSFLSGKEPHSRQLSKRTSCSGIEVKTKSSLNIKAHDNKARVYSENTHDLLMSIQKLKARHQEQEHQLMGGLTQRELHRLKKMYAVEEAKCMLEILQGDS